MKRRYFTNPQTLEELRKEYKRLLKQFHPDNRGGSTEATQEINVEYEELFAILKLRATKADDKKAAYEYDNKMDELLRAALNAVISIDGIKIEIIGCWIWISGNTYDIKDTLKVAGFRWIAKRKLWAFHSEPFRKKSKEEKSMDELRTYYGSQTIKKEIRKALTA